MSSSAQKKILAVLMMGFAGSSYLTARTPPNDFLTPGILAFGLFNLLVTPPGTAGVRSIAICCALASFVWPDYNPQVVGLASVLWPPAFLVTWAVAREPAATDEIDMETGGFAARRARTIVAALIVSTAIASIAYRVVMFHGLGQTAALFIGIPALLAIVVVFMVSPQSATGVACKAVTVGLLISLLLLGEGMVCVLMSALLFYVIAIGIAMPIDRARRRRAPQTTTMSSFILLLAIGPLSLEGVTPLTTINRDETVAVTRDVDASGADVERAILAAPRFERRLPPYLRIGFPRPVATRIDQRPAGTRWIITMRGGEMRLSGLEPRTGDLVLNVEDIRPGRIRWRAVSDSSHMTHFLRWREIDVTWAPVDAVTTRVTWTVRYERGLDPAWYFGPMERYAVRLAAGYLIDSVATP
jgi:hypothetical protein